MPSPEALAAFSDPHMLNMFAAIENGVAVHGPKLVKSVHAVMWMQIVKKDGTMVPVTVDLEHGVGSVTWS